MSQHLEKISPAPTSEAWLQLLAEHMNAEHKGLPDHLDGVYWMDGNAPENLVALGPGKFDAAKRSLALPIWKPGAWMTGARSSQTAHYRGNCVYTFRFNDEYTYASIKPSNTGCYYPTFFVFFDMKLIEEDVWDRRNKFFGFNGGGYMLRRVAKVRDGKLIETAQFQRMVDFMNQQGAQWVWVPGSGGSVSPGGAPPGVSPETQIMER